jgi:hypothetical protein
LAKLLTAEAGENAMKKLARIKKTRPRVRTRISQELTPRQITALIAMLEIARLSFEDCRMAGFDDIPPPSVEDFWANLAKNLRNFRANAPKRNLTLRLSQDDYTAFIYLCMLACLSNCPPAKSSSQVDSKIQLEIFEQLLLLVPAPLKQLAFNRARRNTEQERRRGILQLLATPP